MASCDEGKTSCQDKTKGKNLQKRHCSSFQSSVVDDDSTERNSLIKATSSLKDTCLEPSANKNSESDLIEAQCDMESNCSETNKKRQKKRKKRMKIAQRDLLGDMPLIKNISIQRYSCLDSEVDINAKTDLKVAQLSEFCSESSDSVTNSEEPVTVGGQISLDHSSEVQSFEFLENKLERVHDGEHSSLVKVVENDITEKTSSNCLNSDFACKKSKNMIEIKNDVDLNVPVKEDFISQVLHISLEQPCISRANKKLLILDVNGLLADIVPYIPNGYKADITISKKSVFKRPFCDDFLQFCFEKFNVGIWSSRTKRNVDQLIDFLMGDSRQKLVFCWDQSHCTDTGFTTVENRDKPLVLKELKKLWENCESDLPWSKGEYDESNTLLLDDSPYKALRNPVHTAIFPHSYRYRDTGDSSLGPGGDLRVYLERLVEAQNVQEYVAQNPFGQRAITESNASWGFYRRIITAEPYQSRDFVSSSVHGSN